MSAISQAVQIEERQAIVQLARRFETQIDDDTPRPHVYAAAIALVITHAEFASEQAQLATVLHAAADELTKNGPRFQQAAH